MARLAAVRFVSVGHSHARFRDVVIPLRDRAGRATDSTLWLRNGGGKSSVVSLLFALVRPDLRDFLGAKADGKRRRLRDYIGADDRSVVAAEWELDAPDQDGMPVRLVSGVFYEWRGGTGDDANLHRLFFAARVASDVPALTLEGLPLFTSQDSGGRTRLGMARFSEEWSNLRERYPEHEVRRTTSQKEWAELLTRAGIDPELFGYQLRMNQREGNADEIFRFADHEAFVDFLLELAFDAARADDVSRNIATWRDRLRRRVQEFLPERELVAGLLERMRPLVEIGVRRRSLRERLVEASAELGGLDTLIDGRIQERTVRLEELRQAVEDARAKAEEARAAANDARCRAARLRLFAAEATLSRADQELDATRVRHREAETREKEWGAAVHLATVRRWTSKAEGLKRELERKETEHAPLLAELQTVASQYWAALTSTIEATAQAETAALTEESSMRQQARTAREEVASRLAERKVAETEVAELRRRIEKAKQVRERLERSSTLEAGETGEAALTRWKAFATEARAVAETKTKEEAGAQLALDALQVQARTTAATLAGLEVDASTKRATLSAAQDRRRSLETDGVLLRELELQHLDLERMPDATIHTLDDRGRLILDEVVRAKLDRAASERALRHLEEGGLMPPTPDAEAVVVALAQRLPATASGWMRIAATLPPESRRRFVLARPEIANGVVVRDNDMQAVPQILAEAGLSPEGPVVIASASAVVPGVEPREGVLVFGPASDAHFDRAAAEQERVKLAGERGAIDARIGSLEQRRAELASLVERLRSFRRIHPSGWFAEAEKALADTNATVQLGRQECDRLDLEIKNLAASRGSLGVERAAAEARAVRGDARAVEVGSYVDEYESHWADWKGDSKAREDRIRALEKEAREREEEAARSERKAGETAAAAREHAIRASRLSQERDRIRYIDSQPAAAPGNIELLRDRYEQLESVYQKAVGSEYLNRAHDEAGREAARARDKLTRALGSLLTEAQVAAALDRAGPNVDPEQERSAAAEVTKGLFGQVGNLSQTRGRRAEDLEAAQQRCRDLGVPEVTGDEAPALGPAQALEEETFALEEAEQSTAAAAAEDDRAAKADADAAAAKSEIDLLTTDEQILDNVAERYAEILPVTAPSDPAVGPTQRDVSTAVQALGTRLKHLASEGSSLDAERGRGASAVRTFAMGTAYESLRSVLPRKFAAFDEQNLEEMAPLLVDDLEVRKKNLDDEIADIDNNRALLVTQTLQVAEDGLRLLDMAVRQSRLPEHVRGFGGAQFLRIASSVPDDPVDRRGRIADLVDAMAETGEVPTGLALVQRAVRRLARPIKMRVLFPDASRGHETIDIPELARCSGGEQLTCAILLYCTLAQLRAKQRGTVKRPSSVLVLDNPIGRASLPRFLELQKDVARAMSVQLVYTTGVNDYEAIRVLPHVVRLRNERVDRRTGQQVVEVDEHEIVAARIGRDETAGVDESDESLPS